MGIVGLAWVTATHQRFVYRIIIFIGVAGGLVGSASSGTRASWVSLFFVLLMLIVGFWKLGLRKSSISILTLLIIVTSSFFYQSHSSIAQRVYSSASDIALYYEDSEPRGSLSTRFELWKGSTSLFFERPVFGWGEQGYRESMARLADSGEIGLGNRDYVHAHNDWFNEAAKRGSIGVFVLLGVYFLPIYTFFRSAVYGHAKNDRLIGLGGLVVSLNFLVYGLAHHAFGSNNGIMNYAFWTAVFCGSCIFSRNNQKHVKCS